MKINICILLGTRYNPKGRIAPQIGIASHITNFGHDVTWISSSAEIRDIQKTCLNDVRVFLIPFISYFNFLKIFNTTLYALRRMQFVFKNFKEEKYNIVFVRGDAFDGFLALYIQKRYNVPFVFEMANPIEQAWEIRKNQLKHKWFWYYISKIEAYLFRYIIYKADLVLPTTKWMVEDFAKKGIEKSKMMPYPNGIDQKRFSNANGEKIKELFNLKRSKVITYVGSIAKLRYLDVLIHAFSKVRVNKENVKLLMVGDGNDKSNLEKLAMDLGIEDDVIFVGQVYFDEVPNFVAAGDIGVSPIPPLDFYKLSSPIKMFEYMAMGKPVVANEEIPEQEEVMRESGGGILVKFEAESFANGIIRLLDSPDEAKEMGGMGKEWIMKNGSYEILARHLEERFFKILETS